MEYPENLTVKQAAEFLNVSGRSVYRLLAEAQILGFKVRGSTRIPKKSLQDYVDRQTALFELENGRVENS